MSADVVIFVPTYDERENAPEMVRQLEALALQADLLFLDDDSPDGTGQILDALAEDRPHLHVLHRSGKQGIGSAHQAGIAWAYDHGYRRLVTLDCDFSHSPSDVPRVLDALGGHDVAVGSRWAKRGSLPGWPIHRRLLTLLGYGVTRLLLGIPHDATGALRAYDLEQIPRTLFARVASPGYAFFLESMLVLERNRFRVAAIPIVLPARTFGHSKMAASDILHSLRRIESLWLASLREPERFQLNGPAPQANPELAASASEWDDYWSEKENGSRVAYDAVARVYRNILMKPRLNRALRAQFPGGARLLHAGCGTGEVDIDLQREFRITAVDISLSVLRRYARNVARAQAVQQADVLDLPFPPGSFEGAYNLGVIEHFDPQEVRQHLRELTRVVVPGGKLLLFWPHSRASSAFVLDSMHWLLRLARRNDFRFHPPEPSRLESRAALEELVHELGLEVIDYDFGLRDLFVQAVVVLRTPCHSREKTQIINGAL